jgi:glutamine cyclotransferase
MVTENGVDYIWAHIYQTNRYVKIIAQTGIAVKRLDFRVLDDLSIMTPAEVFPYLTSFDRQNYVFNGFAYDPIEDFYYITGKMSWYIFKIKIY